MTKMRNLNDADIISMAMFATCKVKMERIILLLRNRKSTFVFRQRVHNQVLLEFLTEAKTSIFVVERRLMWRIRKDSPHCLVFTRFYSSTF